MSTSLVEHDQLFGRMLIDLRLATPDQIAQAVDRQKAMQAAGAHRRLGVILVELGVITPEEVRQVLEFQGKSLLSCPACHKTFNVLGATSNSPAHCPECNGALAPVRLAEALEADLRAAGTQVLTPPAPAADRNGTGAPATGPPPSSQERGLPAEGSTGARHTPAVGTAAVARGAGGAGARTAPLPTPASTPPFSGRPFGRYRLLETIGSGGMGVVWKAWDTQLRRVVALKHIKESKFELKADRLRFLREAHLSAKLRHPSIVAVHDVGEAEGRPYITMDFIRGVTLSAELSRSRRERSEGKRGDAATLRVRVTVLADVAAAVAYAHENGVIHRDLKPSNILLDEAGRAYVMDFGLGKEVTAAPEDVLEDPEARESFMQTASGEVLGTPAYMSPEQATGDTTRIGPRSDVWALGISLYEILSGETPFERAGRRPWDILRAVVEQEPSPPAAAAAPGELLAVCLKAIEKDPLRRYDSMQALEADLRRWLRGEPVHARPATVPYRLWRMAIRNKPMVAVGAAMLFVVSLALYFQLRAAEEERRSRELAAEVLRQLHETARLCVDESLAARRAGRLDAGERLTERLRQAYERAQSRLPAPSPEPPFLMGRMLRAGLDDTGAAGFQARALAIDPEFAPALYERAVLLARQVQTRAAEARREALARLGAGLAEAGRLQAPGGTEVREPTHEELEAGDPDLLRLRAETMSALERLRALLTDRAEWATHEEPLLQVGPPRVACVEGMLAAYAGASWEQCSEKLSEALRDEKFLEEAYEAWSFAATRHGRWQEAVEACRRGLEVDGGYVPLWLTRGAANLEWAVRQAAHGEEASENFAAAVADFGKAAELLPQSAEAWGGRGYARMKWGAHRRARGGDPTDLFAEAISDFGRALSVSPGDARLWSRRGGVHLNWGLWRRRKGEDPRTHYEAALEDYDRAIRLDETEAEAWKNRAVVRMNRATWAMVQGGDPAGEYVAALADLDRALGRDPTSADAWNHRGTARMNLGTWRMGRGEDPSLDFAAAIEDFGRAADLRRDDARIARTRGATRMNWGTWQMDHGVNPEPQYAAALEDFDRALQVNPQDPESWRQRGVAQRNLASWRMNRGQDPTPVLQAAIEDFGRALERDAANALAWRDRGMAHKFLGLHRLKHGESAAEAFDHAIEDFTRSLQHNPRQPQVQSWLEESKAAREAARSRPGQTRWRILLEAADAEAQTGRWAKARTLYAEALNPEVLNPPGGDPVDAPGEADRPWLAQAHYRFARLLAQAAIGRDAADGPPQAPDAAPAAQRRTEAFTHLNTAIDLGWDDATRLDQEPDLEPLREDGRWPPLRGRLPR